MTRLAIRPQPLGVYPLPAGYLVLPPAAGAAALAAELVAGRVPAELPPELRFYRLALEGDAGGALAALAGDSSAEAGYNRFVLAGDPAALPALRATLRGDLAALLELAAYTLGWSDAPPPPTALDGELLACVLAAHGACAIEQARHADAADALARAAEAARPASPLLAAQVLGDLAEVEVGAGAADAAIGRYREALDLLGGGLPELRAQLAMRLAMLYQDLAEGRRGHLLEAAKWYQEALKVFSREAHPRLFAMAQNNLALAYLAMPLTEASDQLRMGVAVQSLREALKVYTSEGDPELWSSAQLNLANALQYLPSRRPEEHLAEAVELYEQLLAARDPGREPVGYARILANQANALAHLGIFGHAREKLSEAARLFARAGDADSAAAMVEALASIEQREIELAAG